MDTADAAVGRCCAHGLSLRRCAGKIKGAHLPPTARFMAQDQTPTRAAPLCQEAVARAGLRFRVAGPGCDLSEVPAVGIGLAALDCRVAPTCPPGPASVGVARL
jgi:hypothetical protein